MKVLDKKLLRHLRSSWGQALAIVAVILCGTATFITVASAYRDLLLTRDAYYTRYRFADFNLMFKQAPTTEAFKIEAIPGVRRVHGRIVKDVNLDIAGTDEPRIGRIISMPDLPVEVLDDICLMSGRYFDRGALNEVIVSTDFAKANRLKLGDRVRATIENKKHTLKIVGTALSPEYVYPIRSASELVPSPERFGILWAPRSFVEDAFNMQDACNEIIGTVEVSANLDAVLDKAEKILKPYGVYAKLKRDDQISNRFLSDEIKGLEVSAWITPAIFLGVAALILFVLLNRMVSNERTEIGLLKAYGYSNWAVASYYVKFALVLGVAGCLGGFVVGQWLAYAMIRMYVEFFQFPLLRAQVYADVLVRSMGISVAFALAGAVSAARRAAAIDPAVAMRAPAPKYGHRTVFERVQPVWRRLSFSWKMIVRNVSRYRLRSSITSFGIMVSVGIMIVGFFLGDSMDYMIGFQFSETQREDVRVGLITEQSKSALYDLARFDGVRRVEPMLEYPFEIRTEWRTKDVVVIGLPEDGQLHRLNNEQGAPVDVTGPGLILSDKLAEQLGVHAGSQVRLKPLMGRVTKERVVPVSKIVRQYLGVAAYMNIDALSRILDEPIAMNAALFRTVQHGERALGTKLKDVPAVASVEIKSDSIANIKKTLAQSMSISNMFLAIFSGVIAFAVIYNTTMVSLMERQRELASLRVLGFTIREVGSIVYKENVVLSAVGLLFGFPFGVMLSKLLVRAYDTDLYRLPFHIEPPTFVRAFVLTVVFLALANVAAWRKIKRLDLVEVLKARE